MKLELILVPYDVEKTDTPSARSPLELIDRGFLEALEAAGFDARCEQVAPRPRKDKAMTVAAMARSTAKLVARASSRGRFPLILSASCLTAVGVAHGLQRMGRDFSALWVDAHGDFNTTETTPSGYWDGMALATLCGRSLAEVYKAVELLPVPFRRITHIGGRSFDPSEVEDFDRLRVLRVPPGRLGTGAGAEEEIEARLGCSKGVYLHIDLDALDPEDAPAVNFPVPDGIRLTTLVQYLEHLTPPLAMSLTGLSFESADDAQIERQLDTCVRLVEAVVRGQ